MRKNFFNLHKQDQGILRELAPGVSTRIFPGDHAMLSVVRLDPGCESEIHSHPQEQWDTYSGWGRDHSVGWGFLAHTTRYQSRFSGRPRRRPGARCIQLTSGRVPREGQWRKGSIESFDRMMNAGSANTVMF